MFSLTSIIRKKSSLEFQKFNSSDSCRITRKLLLVLVISTFSFGVMGCSENRDNSASVDSHTEVNENISWPELSELDEILHIHGWQDMSDEEKETLLEDVTRKAESVLSGELPEEVEGIPSVEVYLTDLESLLIEMNKEDQKTLNERNRIMKGMEPIVVKIMESIGMDHSHAGHDH